MYPFYPHIFPFFFFFLDDEEFCNFFYLFFMMRNFANCLTQGASTARPQGRVPGLIANLEVVYLTTSCQIISANINLCSNIKSDIIKIQNFLSQFHC